jgi:hypothetical protein
VRHRFKWIGATDDRRGDLTAVGHGLMLRAEMMNRGNWWWAVYDDEWRKGANQLSASYDEWPYHARTGEHAKKQAERSARYWIRIKNWPSIKR